MSGRPPLEGVRVVEHTHALAGRTAGALLADLGAEVVQVPAAGDAVDPGDPARVWSDRRKSLRGVGVASRPRYAELAWLAAAADVVVVDLPPGRIEPAGLDRETIHAANPSAVHVWMPPYGTGGGGPSRLEADPLLLAAVSGYADNHPTVAGRPVAPVVPTFVYLHGVIGAAAAVAGLVGRQRTGEGSSATVTGLHAMAAVLGSLMIKEDGAGDAFLSAGRSGKGSPYFRLYRGSDGGWLYLAALSPAIFTRALDAIGRIDVMLRDDVAGEFANLVQPAVRDQVGAELEETFSSRPTSEWLEILRAADVPVAPVWDRERWFEEGIGEASRRCRFDHPVLGALTVPSPPVDLPLTPMLSGEAPVAGSGDGLGDPPVPSSPAAVPPPPVTGADRLPLEGVRVVDLCSFLAGPFAAALLADFGADVTKVEPVDGDPYRVFAVSYAMVNQRKRTAALDLADPGARDAFLDLLGGADALIDNFAPGSLDKLGLGGEVVAGRAPGLVRATVSAFGTAETWSATPGFDPVLQAMTGLAIAQGGPGSPVPSSAPAVDAATGALGALGVLAALYARGRWGRVQHVRTSLASGAVLIQSGEMTSYEGRPPVPVGAVDFLGAGPTHRLYQAGDGWLAVAADGGEGRSALLEAVGHPDWEPLDDARLAAALEAEMATRPRRHWLDILFAAGVPAAEVLDHETGIAGPYLTANGFSHLVDVPDVGAYWVVRSFSSWEGGRPRPGRWPALGAHTAEVLVAAGVAPEAVHDLIVRGVAAGPRP